MAYDEGLAERIRAILENQRPYDEKRMFGGLAFMCDGHMVVGIVGDTLMARVGPEAAAHGLREPHVRPMDFTGKPLTGYVFVDPPGFERDEDLERWLFMSLDFVQSLPPKPARPGARGRSSPSRGKGKP